MGDRDIEKNKNLFKNEIWKSKKRVMNIILHDFALCK